jgi:hypothetical protein
MGDGRNGLLPRPICGIFTCACGTVQASIFLHLNRILLLEFYLRPPHRQYPVKSTQGRLQAASRYKENEIKQQNENSDFP